MKNKFLRMLRKIVKANRKETLVNYCEVTELMKNNPDAILLDVRSVQEYNEYHLNGAINIPLYELANKAETILPKDRTIIVYCQSGVRSKRAYKNLERIGI